MFVQYMKKGSIEVKVNRPEGAPSSQSPKTLSKTDKAGEGLRSSRGRVPSSQEVSLSETSRVVLDYAQSKEVVEDVPFDIERVERIKQEIALGKFSVDLEKIAEGLIKMNQELGHK